MNTIRFIESATDELHAVQAHSMVLLIDSNVFEKHQKLFEEFDSIVVPAGERSKSMKLVEELAETLLDMGYQKDSLIVGVGGGVVTDITGFIASVFMRGVSFGYYPTTLLGMCDAALGGKNGVNLSASKNIIGTISQPDFIHIWPSFLQTLPQDEFVNGMAEVIKHAMIDGGDFPQFLLDNKDEIIGKNPIVLKEMIERSARVKMDIVAQDEFDNEKRHLLNLGHTIGHALETHFGIPHGHSVAIGMSLDVKIARMMNMCDEHTPLILSNLLQTFNLPEEHDFNVKEIMEIIATDKKRRKNAIRYIVPVAPGNCQIVNMDATRLENYLYKLK